MQPFVSTEVFADTVDGQLVMIIIANLLRVRSPQHVYDVAHAEALLRFGDAEQEGESVFGAIFHHGWALAIIAVVAILLLQYLSEVAQQCTSAATIVIAIGNHLLQLL